MICEREKWALEVIQRVENFETKNKRLPSTLAELGIDEAKVDLAFYKKISETEFEVWYGTSLGISNVYNSKTKEWQEKG